MRVICLFDSTCLEPNAICVKKDSIYHVTGVKRGRLFPGGSNIWYTLLETSFWQHNSILFALAPDDEENENNEKENQRNPDYIKQDNLESK